MHQSFLIVPVLTAMVGGALLFSPVFRERRVLREVYTMAVTLVTSGLLWALILNRPVRGAAAPALHGRFERSPCGWTAWLGVRGTHCHPFPPLALPVCVRVLCRRADRQNGFLAFYTMTFA